MSKLFLYISLMSMFASLQASHDVPEPYRQQIVRKRNGSLFVMDAPLQYYVDKDGHGVGVRVGIRYLNEELIAKNNFLVMPYNLNPYIYESYGIIPLDEIQFRKEGEVVLLKLGTKYMEFKCTNQEYTEESFADRIQRLKQQFIENPPRCAPQDIPRLLAEGIVVVNDRTGRLTHGPHGIELVRRLPKKNK